MATLVCSDWGLVRLGGEGLQTMARLVCVAWVGG